MDEKFNSLKGKQTEAPRTQYDFDWLIQQSKRVKKKRNISDSLTIENIPLRLNLSS